MKLMYLGTAAAEGMPAVFCNCPTCLAAKRTGGRNIRTRSQILVNDDLLVDFPMDTYMHMLKFRLDLTRIQNVFITHSHMDHCYTQDLCMHGAPYAHDMTESKLNIYGSDTVMEVFAEQTRREMKDSVKATLTLNPLIPYQTVETERYRVTALPAVHTAGENCFIYLIEENKKSVLIMNDTGILADEVYETLARRKVVLSAVSFDCTYGYAKKGLGRHMGVLDNLDEKHRMESFGLVTPRTKYIVTHFSHNGATMHAELKKKLKPLNLLPAYDGMKVNI